MTLTLNNPLNLLDINASMPLSPFVKLSCLNALTIFSICSNNNDCRHHQVRIATLHLLITTLRNTISRVPNQNFRIHTSAVTLTAIPLPNKRRINLTNQILPIAGTNGPTKKGYIRLIIIMNLAHIYRAFIQLWIKMPRRFNTRIKALTK